MRWSGKTLMSLSVMAIAGWMVVTSLHWPLRTAIFILAIGIPVFCLAILESCLSLFEKEDACKEAEGADFAFPEEPEPAVANRRTISIFLWILGFFFLIVLIGFPIAVPLFLFLFLKLHGETWGISLGLAAAGWVSFYGLFVRLLNLPFLEGWMQGWLRIMAKG